AHHHPSAAHVVIVDALDETLGRKRSKLVIRYLGGAHVDQAGDAHSHPRLVDVAAVVGLPTDQTHRQHSVDDGQIHGPVEIIIAAGVRGLRSFHGQVAAE